ncbi:MAG TPA: hypothetical protein VF625_18995 [Longimicrobium sp.]
MKLIIAVATIVLAPVGAVALTPSSAAAQCKWGCACQGTSCGCNSRGNGADCVASGTGCVVGTCGAEDHGVAFAPDGSVVRLASQARPDTTMGAELTPSLGETARWEFVSAGHSVARHCSGIIVARYFDSATAAALRDRDRTLTL